MKKFLLFCFMGATTHAFAQPGPSLPEKLPVPSSDTSVKKPVIFIRCGSTLKNGDQPLLVVDGIALEYSNLSQIKPTEIENITVLKESAATALYGYRAARGVLVITTKKARERTFSIRSKEDGVPVAGATVKIINEKVPADTMIVVANNEGEVKTSKLDAKKEYSVIISSVGYKPRQASLIFKEGTDHPMLYLERKENVCENIIVEAYPIRRIVCYMGCGGVITRTRKNGTGSVLEKPSAGIYPNPSTSSGLIHKKLDEPFDGVIQVLGATGQLLQSSAVSGFKGDVLSHRLPVLNAGTYFIRMIDPVSSRSRVEKLIVQ